MVLCLPGSARILGLCGKVLVAGGAAGLASTRRDQELASCWTEPVSASSKTESLLAKADLISDAGGASVITY